MNQSRSFLFLGLFIAALFVAGLARLFTLRFESGDIYPPYSSLRADPLGTKAFFDSLAALPQFDVTRNYRPVARLAHAPTQTVIFAGVTDSWLSYLPQRGASDLDLLLLKGDRLVITLLPVTTPPSPPVKPAKKKALEKKDTDVEADEEEPMVVLTNRWGFAVAYQPASVDLTGTGAWHTLTYFTNLDSAWQVHERFRGQPVLIERPFRRGSLVLAADSYFLSNEALRDDRQTVLLARLPGPHRRVVFDETLHGVREAPGVTQLARQYRLHGLFAGLLLLAGLYVWKNAVPFIPPEPVTDVAPAAGKEAAAGFVNLLRRSIPPAELGQVCFAEWQKSFQHEYRRRPAKWRAAEQAFAAHAALPAQQRDPVALCRELTSILQRKRTP